MHSQEKSSPSQNLQICESKATAPLLEAKLASPKLLTPHDQSTSKRHTKPKFSFQGLNMPTPSSISWHYMQNTRVLQILSPQPSSRH